MASRLFVKNWSKFQHYKQRRPPWIKLATDTFQNYEFSKMQPESKLLALCIWTFASSTDDGSLPDDFEYIRNQGNLGDKIKPEHLKELISQGFVLRKQVASDSLADCPQNAMPEESRGEAEESTNTVEMGEFVFKPLAKEILMNIGVVGTPLHWSTIARAIALELGKANKVQSDLPLVTPQEVAAEFEKAARLFLQNNAGTKQKNLINFFAEAGYGDVTLLRGESLEDARMHMNASVGSR